jgi:hypothetical protein
LHILQIKQFKWFVINVLAIMHLDTHFLEFEFIDYDNVKPFKNIFFKHIFWYDTTVHCMCLVQ